MKNLLSSLLIASALLLPGTASAQPTQAKDLTGIWMFWALLPGQTQPSYVGTAQYEGNGTISGAGIMGQWVRTGNQEFAFTFLANTFDTTGNYTGTHRVRGMITLRDDAVTATGKTLLEILDPTGAVVFTAPGPTSFTGVKLAVTPF